MRGARRLQAVLELLLLLRHDAHAVHELCDVRLNRSFHCLEHVERLDLVLDERIPLPVGAQIDALTQHVHAIEMLHPMIVDDAQHDDLLKLAHVLLAEELLTRRIGIARRRLKRLFQLIAAHRLKLFLLELALGRVDLLRVLDESVERPLLRI